MLQGENQFSLFNCCSFVAGLHHKMAAKSRPGKATNFEGASEVWLPATPTNGRVRAAWSAAVYNSESRLDSLQEHDSDHVHAVCCSACSRLCLRQRLLPGIFTSLKSIDYNVAMAFILNNNNNNNMQNPLHSDGLHGWLINFFMICSVSPLNLVKLAPAVWNRSPQTSLSYLRAVTMLSTCAIYYYSVWLSFD